MSMLAQIEQLKGDLERAIETSKKDAVLLNEKFETEQEKFSKVESLYKQVSREKEQLEETVQEKSDSTKTNSNNYKNYYYKNNNLNRRII